MRVSSSTLRRASQRTGDGRGTRDGSIEREAVW